MEGLHSLFQTLSAEGEKTETLDFTLDTARAAQKLSRSQLPDPALWIVKMVQAAVAGEAGEVDIKLGKNRVEVRFETELEQSALEIFELVTRGILPKDTALLHLVTGMRGALSGPGHAFLLQTTDSEGREIVALSEGESYRYQDSEGATERKTLTFVVTRPFRLLAFKKSLNMPVNRLMRGTADEHCELVRRCWPSPIPIRIDGKLLQTGYDSPLIHNRTPGRPLSRHLFNLMRQKLPQVNLYLRYLEAEPGEATLPTPPEEPDYKEVSVGEGTALLRQPVCLDETFMLWDKPPERVGGVLLCGVGFGRKGGLFFLQDGVVVQRVGLRLQDPWHRVLGMFLVKMPEAGGDLYLQPVEQKDLDLSHFSVKDVENRRKKILEFLVPVLWETEDLMMEAVKEFVYVPAPRKRVKSALALSSTAVLPVGLAFGATGLSVYAAYQSILVGGQFVFRQFGFRYQLKASHKFALKKREEFSLEKIEQEPI